MAIGSRRSLGRLHLWLGWLIGVPLLFWTVSGLWMVSRPIEEVRGAHLKAEPPTLPPDVQPVFPKLPSDHGAPVSVRLEQQQGGAVWIATFAHGHEMRASASDGRWLPDVSVVSATHTPADRAPLDLRKQRPAWAIAFADGTRADSGSLLAIRTNQWRAFDFMWGLHIMDLQTREDSSHPLLILFAAVSAVGILTGLILLPMASRIRKAQHEDR
jgi:hypothetical protein